jgi:CheY-like chemotaxis protein
VENAVENTILLVEDNEDNRAIYRTILTYGGFTVIEAVDGEEAIERARRDLPSLILMDISIPKIDGWQATRMLKLAPSTMHIPIIALTAHALPSDRKEAADAGYDGYLARPVEPRRVLEEVRRLLHLVSRPRTEAQAADPVSAG